MCKIREERFDRLSDRILAATSELSKFRMTEDHWKKAVQNPVQQTAEMDRQGLTMNQGAETKNAFSTPSQGISNSFDDQELEKVGDTGLERNDVKACKIKTLRTSRNSGDAESGALFENPTQSQNKTKVALILSLIDQLSPAEFAEFVQRLARSKP